MARAGGPPPNIYDGMTFPDYKFHEYPKEITHPADRRRVTVQNQKEELAVLSHTSDDELTEAESERDNLARQLAELQAQRAADMEELERLRLETGKTVMVTPGGIEAVTRTPAEVDKGFKPSHLAPASPVTTQSAPVPSNARDGGVQPSSRLTANLKDGKNDQTRTAQGSRED